MKRIGITTTVPIEVLIAAGYEVVDLNNIFVCSKDYLRYIDKAEKEGFPKSCCAWKKAMYSVVLEEGIEEIVGVTEGDCSNTKALEEVLSMKGIKVYPFSYPQSQKLEDIQKSIDEFMKLFNVTIKEVEEVRDRLNAVRASIIRLDELTYKEGKTSGFENHLYQVSASDFNSNVDNFQSEIIEKIHEIELRTSNFNGLKIGYIGVPPMTVDIYDFVEKFDADIIYNEVQREFSFPRFKAAKSIYEQYKDYTYPYNINFRLKEIQKQIKERDLDGLIHYTQAFCYKQIEDIVIKNHIKIPILTIEGDKLNYLDARTKLRLEAFLDMVKDLKEMKS
ncbi:MAG: 2-hydroxyacyl-CoA dehydratase [Clostridiaceae bacterium]|nr:2-hydroxyacyl-CoA dehydratase [Clostridiaceae bacterium]